MAIQIGNYDAAIGTLSRMLLFNPNLPRVRLELGALYFQLASYPAAKALGYAGILLSGSRARAPRLRRALGLSDTEDPIGFFTLGCPIEPPRPRPLPADHLSTWRGLPPT